MYHFRASLGPVDLAFTDRYDGVSGAPFAELNLAREGDDDERARSRNHRLVLDDFAPGDALVDLHQVHGAEVAVVERPPDPTASDGPARADGLVTAMTGLTLMVRAADCAPVLLADPDAGVIGAAHSGRPGLVAGIVPATVRRMRDLGARQITGWLGPHICGACYEVPEEMQQRVGEVVPEAVATTSWGTPSLDIGAGVRAQLARAGVELVDASRCTRESADLYSYRRDGDRAGRLAGLIRRHP